VSRVCASYNIITAQLLLSSLGPQNQSFLWTYSAAAGSPWQLPVAPAVVRILHRNRPSCGSQTISIPSKWWPDHLGDNESLDVLQNQRRRLGRLFCCAFVRFTCGRQYSLSFYINNASPAKQVRSTVSTRCSRSEIELRESFSV
jgi:hypothetical protein